MHPIIVIRYPFYQYFTGGYVHTAAQNGCVNLQVSTAGEVEPQCRSLCALPWELLAPLNLLQTELDMRLAGFLNFQNSQ